MKKGNSAFRLLTADDSQILCPFFLPIRVPLAPINIPILSGRAWILFMKLGLIPKPQINTKAYPSEGSKNDRRDWINEQGLRQECKSEPLIDETFLQRKSFSVVKHILWFLFILWPHSAASRNYWKKESLLRLLLCCCAQVRSSLIVLCCSLFLFAAARMAFFLSLSLFFDRIGKLFPYPISSRLQTLFTDIWGIKIEACFSSDFHFPADFSNSLILLTCFYPFFFFPLLSSFSFCLSKSLFYLI